MMRVSCFCGREWDTEHVLDSCPRCGEPAVLPTVTAAEIGQMQAELALLLSADPLREQA